MSKNAAYVTSEKELQGVQNREANRVRRDFDKREHLRLEIKSRELMDKMHTAAFMLYDGFEVMEDADTGEIRIIPLSRDRIAGMKAAADISCKLLNKVLPDVKQIEIQVDDKGGEGRILENTDLSNRMRIYVEALAKRRTEVTHGNEIEDAVIVEDTMDFLK